MGFNPGETKEDWKVTEGKRTQETSQFDFLSFYNKRKNNKWSKSVKDMLGEFNIAQTELFFWSSPNVKTLHDRIGNLFNSEEMQFCTRMNYDLFDHYRPSCIVFTGISHAKFVEETFELIKVHEEKSDKGRLFIEYKDKNSTPWMVTKHFTGSFGFKNSDKEIIRNRVSQLVNAAD